MLDFGVLPPEITSTQMYSGPGSGPMMVAASAWDALAAQLDSFARGYSSVVSGLQGEGWAGPASNAMAAAATPYAQWAATTAVQAEQAASQARGSAAAFETAHAAVVPPAVVAANRTQLAHLIATNLLGQNTTAIATTEAHYAEMWAQDTQAMYGYAASVSSATRLSPFTAAPPTANPAGQSAQAAATATQAAGPGASHLQALSQVISSVPQQLSSLASSASATPGTSSVFGMPISTSLLSSLGSMNTLDGPVSFAMAAVRTAANAGTFSVAGYRLAADAALYAPLAGLSSATSPVTFGASAGLAGAAAAGVQNAVLASAAKAGLVGPLSVPPAWAHATPVAAASEQPLWLSEVEAWWEAGAPANLGGESMAEVAAAAAMGAMLARPIVSKALRVAPRRFKMSRPESGG